MYRTIEAMLVASMLLGLGCSGDDGGGSDAGDGDAGPCDPLQTPPLVIDADTTLSGCYLVPNLLAVENDATLTLTAGTTLFFAQDAGLEIRDQAALVAIGTDGDPILLTGVESVRGYWRGVEFSNADSFSNRMEWVTVAFGGGEDYAQGEPANLALTSSGYDVRLSLSHTTLRDSAGYGLYAADEARFADFSANVLTSNALGAAWVEADAVGDMDPSTRCVGNDRDVVLVDAVANLITRDARWPALDVPYVIDGVLYVRESPGVTLTIAPGATLLFRLDAGVEVTGDNALVAAGTAAEPITFSWAQAGDAWRGLLLENAGASANLLDYAVVEHAGAYEFESGVFANIALTSSGDPTRLTLRNSEIRDSAGYGVWVSRRGMLDESMNTYSGNASSPDVFLEAP